MQGWVYCILSSGEETHHGITPRWLVGAGAVHFDVICGRKLSQTYMRVDFSTQLFLHWSKHNAKAAFCCAQQYQHTKNEGQPQSIPAMTVVV